jgi:isopentenyl-diphosphate delta-isomerase
MKAMNEEQVILVNENDESVGVMDKMEVHKKGLLHRAFSVFIFDSRGQILLQQRSDIKYHGAGLWTNACCSHPRTGESTMEAAQRRLYEELGFKTELEEIFSFTYRAEVENQLIEHEFDHVFAGEYNGDIRPNPDEVAGYCFTAMGQIRNELATKPEKFTSWFRIAFPRIEEWWVMRYKK